MTCPADPLLKKLKISNYPRERDSDNNRRELEKFFTPDRWRALVSNFAKAANVT